MAAAISRSCRLAILGGSPSFAEPLHVGRPVVANRAGFLARVNRAIDSRWLTNHGPLERELERRLAGCLGVRHVVTVANGTLALQLAASALDLTGEVIVPSFTFVATAQALGWVGLTPVFCDVDPATHTIDPADAARLLTRRTSAILGVHLWGTPCDVAGLTALAARHHLHLFFDAAHAFGASLGAAKVGGFGEAEAFSFHATKLFHTIEGGAVATNRDEVAAQVRRLRSHGAAGPGGVRGRGINATMSEIAAAMGLATLGQVGRLAAGNLRRHERYVRGLAGLPGVRVVRFGGLGEHPRQFVVVEVGARAALTRDELLAVLRAENILARDYFSPGCHSLEGFRRAHARRQHPLPRTERLCETVLCLPTGAAVAMTHVDRVCAIVRAAFERADEVKHALARRRAAKGARA